jgi:hypothetical protein
MQGRKANGGTTHYALVAGCQDDTTNGESDQHAMDRTIPSRPTTPSRNTHTHTNTNTSTHTNTRNTRARLQHTADRGRAHVSLARDLQLLARGGYSVTRASETLPRRGSARAGGRRSRRDRSCVSGPAKRHKQAELRRVLLRRA